MGLAPNWPWRYFPPTAVAFSPNVGQRGRVVAVAASCTYGCPRSCNVFWALPPASSLGGRHRSHRQSAGAAVLLSATNHARGTGLAGGVRFPIAGWAVSQPYAAALRGSAWARAGGRAVAAGRPLGRSRGLLESWPPPVQHPQLALLAAERTQFVRRRSGGQRQPAGFAASEPGPPGGPASFLGGIASENGLRPSSWRPQAHSSAST